MVCALRACGVYTESMWCVNVRVNNNWACKATDSNLHLLVEDVVHVNFAPCLSSLVPTLLTGSIVSVYSTPGERLEKV